jgi:hypothetical protein
MVPPPQLLLQLVQSDQLDTWQLIGQAWVLHALFSVRVGHDTPP